MPVQSAEDRVEYDSQLQHREMHPIISHPELGECPNEGYPVKMSRTLALRNTSESASLIFGTSEPGSGVSFA